jgi:hypothetical protein
MFIFKKGEMTKNYLPHFVVLLENIPIFASLKN